ncbi:MAG: hypothetical protein IKK75_02105 [Clostridia bacterium]|nr:hypothetical protein [Clostridia bacterium]
MLKANNEEASLTGEADGADGVVLPFHHENNETAILYWLAVSCFAVIE